MFERGKTEDEKDKEKEEKAKYKQEQEELLVKYKEEDEIKIAAIKNYIPDVKIKEYKAGDFLYFGKFEAPRKYIESFTVANFGGEPHWVYNYSAYSRDYAACAVEAVIIVTMASGATHRINCHRLAVDILLDKLKETWKKG